MQTGETAYTFTLKLVIVVLAALGLLVTTLVRLGVIVTDPETMPAMWIANCVNVLVVLWVLSINGNVYDMRWQSRLEE